VRLFDRPFMEKRGDGEGGMMKGKGKGERKGG